MINLQDLNWSPQGTSPRSLTFFSFSFFSFSAFSSSVRSLLIVRSFWSIWSFLRFYGVAMSNDSSNFAIFSKSSCFRQVLHDFVNTYIVSLNIFFLFGFSLAKSYNVDNLCWDRVYLCFKSFLSICSDISSLFKFSQVWFCSAISFSENIICFSIS